MLKIRRVSFLLATAALFQCPPQVASFQIFPVGSSLPSFPRISKSQEEQQQATLQKTLGIPDGLMNTLLDHNKNFSKRIWIVDNSGSMGMSDGHQLMDPRVDCTRWKELEETVLLHAQLSAALHAPTEFRLLNTPGSDSNRPSKTSSFQVKHRTTMKNSLKQARNVLSRTKPSGATPLTESVSKVRQEVINMLPQLEADGTKVCIVIVTDGCNHSLENILGKNKDEKEMNAELSEALESLQGLPVSVVLRLCTDYGPLVDFYNEVDERLDGFDVIDDYLAEAQEVYTHNPWLNYCLVIHRMREMGQFSHLFDWLDERTLTRDELKEFCTLLFGTQHDFPDPNTDWQGFLTEIHRIQSQEKWHFNPRTQKLAPWIDVEFLAMLE